MSEERKSALFTDELAAIKDSRNRDMPVFFAKNGEDEVWVVAVSDHQAKLALVDRVWPMAKYTKRNRDERYTALLEMEFERQAGGKEWEEGVIDGDQSEDA